MPSVRTNPADGDVGRLGAAQDAVAHVGGTSKLMLQADHRLTTLPSMHPLIEAHRAELLALARRRGVTGVRVFGSMSRGDGSDNSDVDLLVTLAPGTSALALGGLLLDAQELLGRRVDVVTEASLHHALRDRVMASAVPL